MTSQNHTVFCRDHEAGKQVGSPRVVIVGPRLDIGGTERHIARIVPALRKRGLDISVLALRPGGILENELISAGAPVLWAANKPRATAFEIIWGLRRELLRLRPDVVHFFLPEPYILGVIAAELAGCRTRLMSRRSLATYHKKHPISRYVEAFLHRRTTALIGNSTAVCDELCFECGEKEKVGLIHNGVAIGSSTTSAEQKRDVRRSLGMNDETLVLVTVANLIPYKGHADVLDALSRAQSQMPPEWQWLVIGRDDGIGAELAKKADALDIGKNICWLGEVRNPEPFLAASDLGILPSHEEGFSNALIEAMAAGLPMIATAVGGNTDAIEHLESGLLVPPRAPDELAEAIIKLATTPPLRRTLGERGAERVRTEFSEERCLDRYEAIYRGFAANRNTALSSLLDPLA